MGDPVKKDEVLEKIVGLKEGAGQSGENLTDEQHQALADHFDFDKEKLEIKPAEKSAETNEDGTPKVKSPDEEAAAQAAAEAAAVEKERLELLAKETGKTVEQIQQEEAAEAEVQQKEQERLEKAAKEQGKTVEEIKTAEKEAADKAETARLEAVAKEEGITVEQVKENEAKDKVVLERHGNDPKKLGRALRKEQSEYGKLKQELDDLKEAQTQKEKILDEQKFAATLESKRDEIINKYREVYSNDAADQSDEVVFDRAKGLLRASFEKAIMAEQEAIKKQAGDRRMKLMEGLPKDYDEVKVDIRAMLDVCQDAQVLSKKFDVSFIAEAARGRKYTPEYVKKLTDAAYRRGLEQPKISAAANLGRTKTVAPPPGGGTKITLTESEKERAKAMFGNKGWTDQRMFEEFQKNHQAQDSVW